MHAPSAAAVVRTPFGSATRRMTAAHYVSVENAVLFSGGSQKNAAHPEVEMMKVYLNMCLSRYHYCDTSPRPLCVCCLLLLFKGGIFNSKWPQRIK